jgi:uncharacterized protein
VTDAVPAVRPLPPPVGPPVPLAPPVALRYHRLAHAWPGARWWRPLVGLLISVGLYLGASVLIMIVLAIVAVLSPGFDAAAPVVPVLDQYDPGAFLLTMGSIVLMLPAALLGFRLAGCRPIGLLSSVAGRLRWRWMLWCAGPAAILLAAVLALDLVLQAAGGGVQLGRVGSPLLFVLILLVVPFQAAAEEYAFRGVLMQMIGAWLRSPWWAILLPVPLFVFGHLYDLPGLISVGVFAVAAGWITWRTGGLEAAIALHVVNNLGAFVFGAAGLSDLNGTQVGWLGALTSSVIPIVFVLWADAAFRRRGDVSRERWTQAASSA